MRKNISGFITLPAAIVIAAAIIAIAIIWVNKPETKITDTTNTASNPLLNFGPEINLKPISSADRLLGNPSAPITMLEFSDPSCPYCKIYSSTLEKVIATYVASGTVALAYRSYPLDTPDSQGRILHPNANNESQAIECAGDIGGTEKYWSFITKLYQVTPAVTSQSPNGLDQSQLPIIAKDIGLDVAKFNSCLSSGKWNDKVKADFVDGVNAGVNGTPFTFFILKNPANSEVDKAINAISTQLRLSADMLYLSKDRKILAMSGAMPFEVIQALIETIILK
jgi:protein-disulfide isomerase